MSLISEWVPVTRTIDDHIDMFENINVLRGQNDTTKRNSNSRLVR